MRLRGPPSPWSLWSTRTLIRASSVETRQGLKKPKDADLEHTLARSIIRMDDCSRSMALACETPHFFGLCRVVAMCSPLGQTQSNVAVCVCVRTL